MPSKSPQERSIISAMGAHALHSQRDPKETTAAGRAKFLERFLDEVDPDRVLPEPERLRRAEHAKSKYFLGLALRSAKARARKAGSS